MIVRDPVLGDLQFTANETKIMDSPEIQRLRGIKQLGTAYLVYPGALHTRFEHSLGTSYLAKKIMYNIKANGTEIPAETEELVAIAGLLHDVTHVPFGHTFEDERKIFERHDKSEYFKITLSKGIINDVISELGIKQDLLKILTQKDPSMNGKKDPWQGQIINDTICSDLLDYIRRDCYYTGINKNYDDRVFSYFIIDNNKLVLNFGKNKMERSDARSEILHLLRLRYFLTERVYFHHAKLSSGAMISKAVEIAVKNNKLTRDNLLKMDDWTLLNYLEKLNDNNLELQSTKELITRLRSRDLLKRSYVLSSATLSSRKSRDEFITKFNPPTNEREQVEDMIIDRLRKIAKNNNISKADVIIHCLSSSSLKEADVLIKTKDSKIQPLNARPYPSVDIKSIEDSYEDLWRMYVFANKKYTKEVASICERTFGRENEFSPK
ncbi:MAG: HD domain-containing protein [Asgard group archaeon]|nr:HD domain-containing protein [Asgard group archaeon]